MSSSIPESEPGLVLATRNRHKLEELRALLARDGLSPDRVAALPDGPEVVEDGRTFEENAVKKAVAAALATGGWALADDSGLEVDALGGEPGVRSARYAGEGAGDARNNAKLLEALAGHVSRRARFRCVLALCRTDGVVHHVEGSCEGTILKKPRGAQGFGYDPLFLPDGFDRSFAELDSAEKNRISHRALAWAAARAAWFARGFPPADFSTPEAPE
jgi:XTP/dITP diphosphohydrolase